MSRSKYTDPKEIRAARRLRTPREGRGVGDLSRRRELGGKHKDAGVGPHESQGRARHSVRAVGKSPNATVTNRGAQRTDAPYQKGWPGLRIVVRKSRPGFHHPADKQDVLEMGASVHRGSITGNIGINGGGCNFMHNTWPGGLNLPPIAGATPKKDVALPVGPDYFAESILTEKPYALKAIVTQGNPILGCANTSKVKEAFRKLEFCVYTGLFIQGGETILVESPRGSVTGTALLWDGIREDTIFVPNTFGPMHKIAEDLRAPLYEPANTLVSDRYYDNLSGQQAHNCFACRVRKLEQKG